MGMFIENVLLRCDTKCCGCASVCARAYGHEWMNRYTSHLVKLFKYRIKYLASVIFLRTICSLHHHRYHLNSHHMTLHTNTFNVIACTHELIRISYN